MKVRAIENNIPIMLANIYSTETFRGDNRVIDSNGKIFINAFNEERIISYEISNKLLDSDNLLEEIMCYSF